MQTADFKSGVFQAASNSNSNPSDRNFLNYNLGVKHRRCIPDARAGIRRYLGHLLASCNFLSAVVYKTVTI
jgi:hypothetical protein